MNGGEVTMYAPQTRAASANALSLAELWAYAERLGRIEVERNYEDTIYKVELKFKNRQGSVVWAVGSATAIYDALKAAIEEALRLGALPR